MGKFYVLLMYACLSISVVFGQQVITGKVSNAENSNPLANVSVVVAGSGIAVQTDDGGNYRITVPIGGEELIFSMVGYETLRQPVDRRTVIDVQMVPAAQDLDEVVVTALGITRQERSLGYSATVVNNEELTNAVSNNWTDALSGKVAGLNLVRSNAGPAGSNSIILRGESNLTGSNDALIVVDGVVINGGSGRMVGNGEGSYLDSDSPVDFGSGLNDINPADIQEVTVLKGPAAAALYGQRGANGALIITTKSGNQGVKGLGFTFNSNTAFDIISRWPDYQYEYGQGNGTNYYSFGPTEDGNGTQAAVNAFGPKFDGQLYYQYDPQVQGVGTERTPWVAYPDGIKGYFDVGRTYTNSLSMYGETANSQMRLSYTNLVNKWIMPNTGYDRNTVSLSAGHKIGKGLQLKTNINYTNRHSDNLPATGLNNQTVMYWAMFSTPNQTHEWLRNYWVEGFEGIRANYPFNANPESPYMIAYEMLNKQNRNGVTGNVSAQYDFSAHVNLMVRSALDFAMDERSQQRPFDTGKFPEGMYRMQYVSSRENTHDFLLTYKGNAENDFGVNISVGGSHLTNRFLRNDMRADKLLYPDIFTLANSKERILTIPYESRYTINSLYGLASLSYKDLLYLDVTGRNDWNSVLATSTSTDNVSFFYPSANLSFILSDAVKLPDFVSFTKLRLSYAGVGSGRNDPYQTSVGYQTDPNFTGGLSNSLMLANERLKPLYTESYEVGLVANLFNGRLETDFALYQSNTRNQILSASVDRATGVNSVIVNAGEVRNQGIEVGINAKPVVNQNGFNWSLFGTFSANANKVLSMTPDLPEIQLQTGPGSAVMARVGGNMSSLWGIGYQRSPSGEIVYQDGYPLTTTDMIYLGNTNPKWKASLGNEFRYKRFRFNFLVDGQYGGVAYSMTHSFHYVQGKIKSTLPGREEGTIIGKGVIMNPDGTYRPNDVPAANLSTYYQRHGERNNVEGNLFKTDFLKLREVRLDYSISGKGIEKYRLQRMSVGVFGRDLLIRSEWPQFDPEFGTLNDGTIDKGIETSQLPSTRNIGLQLTLVF